jgi:outer membrane protein assembly factor BamD
VKRCALGGALLVLAACGGGGPPAPKVSPTPVTQVAVGASKSEIDSLWKKGEFEPGDGRVPKAHFYLGESNFAMGSQLTAVREFRKVSDETPNDPLAPDALLRAGDAYADLWRRPELDPSYGQTALATYQELVNRYPEGTQAKRAQARITDLQERFAYKEYKAALYYVRLKAWDSAILYLKDLVATYPHAAVAPDALMKLVQAYRTLGYKEDVQETCGYIRRFHPKANGIGEACPSDSTEAS